MQEPIVVEAVQQFADLPGLRRIDLGGGGKVRVLAIDALVAASHVGPGTTARAQRELEVL